MKLPLAYYGDPILRKKCPPVAAITDEIRQLIKDMEETMRAHDGIGLAAPQVHRSLAIFITSASDDPDDEGVTRVFINPKILNYSAEEWPRGEGCLSLPQIYGVVVRPLTITVEATDLEGRRFTEEFTGLPARAIMHENDHINGVLFIDRIRGKERQQLEGDLHKLKKAMLKAKR